MGLRNKLANIGSKVLRNPVFIFTYQFLGTVFCISLVTVILRFFEPYLAIQYIALLYLLPVMASTALWGLPPGILAAFLSFLFFNYFFIQPYNTLLVYHTEDLITLIIFLIVAMVMSQLIGRAREGKRLARLREREATCMYQLISALAGLKAETAVAQVLANQTLNTFHFSRVETHIKAWMDEPSILLRAPEDVKTDETATSVIPMATARNTEGEIYLWYKQKTLSIEENRLLKAFCDQGALTIERIHLLKIENKAHILEESDRMKTALLNSVSHEFRSPLAAIKASVSSLRVGAIDWDSTARTELLTTVEEESDSLILLVSNLLDISRIEAGALNPQIKWNSISEIIMSVATKMRNRIQDHPIILNLPESLPLVPTDFVMMEQVFTNLISNSVKYAAADTQIMISGKKLEDALFVRVENQSPHVPEEHLEHIFDKFFRITQSDKVTGTGLGLSICKGIIETHGGKIWAENMPKGFSFCFTLPLALNGALPDTPKDS
jgi:two-component system sensor histidine kinase KdpD